MMMQEAVIADGAVPNMSSRNLEPDKTVSPDVHFCALKAEMLGSDLISFSCFAFSSAVL